MTKLYSMLTSLRRALPGNEFHLLLTALLMLLLAGCEPMQLPDQRTMTGETNGARSLSDQGLVSGNVMGSYMHLIDVGATS